MSSFLVGDSLLGGSDTLRGLLVPESATGSAETAVISPAAADTGSGAEAWSIVATFTTTEAGVGSESGPANAESDNETASATDAATIAASFTQTDQSNGTGPQIEKLQQTDYLSVSSGTNHSITFPAATAGNLLVLAASASFTFSSGPAGWTLAQSVVFNTESRIYYKVAAGGETSAAWVISGVGDSVATALEYDGMAAASLVDQSTSATDTVGATFSTGTTSATTNGYDLVLALFSDSENNTWSGYTAGYTELSDLNADTGSFQVSQALAQHDALTTGTQVASAVAANVASNRQALIVAFTGYRSTAPDIETESVAEHVDTSSADTGYGAQNFFGTTAPAGDSGDTGDVVLGLAFTADVDGAISGARFHKEAAASGTHIAYLWEYDAGTPSASALLATVTFGNETASGWQEQDFDAPVPITAGTLYLIGVYFPGGHYSVDGSYFGNIEVGQLNAARDVGARANGLFIYTSTPPEVPDSSFAHSNYWVDVTFDGETQIVSPSEADSGSGTESQTISATLSETDTASGLDEESVNEGDDTEEVTEDDTLDGAEGDPSISTIVSESSNPVDAATVAATVAPDTGTGTENETSNATSTVAESALATDEESSVATLASSDLGSSSDDATIVVAITSTELLNGDDAAALSQALTETAEATEAESSHAAFTVVEAGVGTESPPAEAQAEQDFATGVEASTSVATPSDEADSSSGSDTHVLTIPTNDPVTVTDANSTTATIAAAETVGSLEVAALATTGADSATASENVTVTRQVSGDDDGSGSETLAVAFSQAESSFSTETTIVAASQAQADVAAGSEAESIFAPENEFTETDTATAAEAVSIVITVTDTTVTADLAVLEAEITTDDPAFAAEIFVLSALLPIQSDSATTSDNLAVSPEIESPTQVRLASPGLTSAAIVDSLLKATIISDGHTSATVIPSPRRVEIAPAATHVLVVSTGLTTTLVVPSVTSVEVE